MKTPATFDVGTFSMSRFRRSDLNPESMSSSEPIDATPPITPRQMVSSFELKVSDSEERPPRERDHLADRPRARLAEPRDERERAEPQDRDRREDRDAAAGDHVHDQAGEDRRARDAEA